MKLQVGDIIWNDKAGDHFPGCPDFKRGHYLVQAIRDGYTASKLLKPEDRQVYELVRCTAAGKPFKTMHPRFCKAVDADIDKGFVKKVG